MANRGWGLSNQSKYRIHPCYEDVTDPNTCKWIVCMKKENLKKPEEKMDVMAAFGKVNHVPGVRDEDFLLGANIATAKDDLAAIGK